MKKTECLPCRTEALCLFEKVQIGIFQATLIYFIFRMNLLK